MDYKLLTNKNIELRFGVVMISAMIPRVLLHVFYFGFPWSAAVFDMYYLFILHFSIFFGVEMIHKYGFKQEIKDLKSYYTGFAPYWLFLYSAIPLITVFVGSSYSNTIPLFRYIPTFLEYRNFLPPGMVYVIPLIFFYGFFHISRHSGLKVIRILLALGIVLLIIYLLYYQWFYSLHHILRERYSADAAMGVYNMILLSILLAIQWQLYKRNVFTNKIWLHVTCVFLYTYSFILAYRCFNYLTEMWS